MSVPKISVVVPIYNVEKYLDRCVESILNQGMKEIEVILVDDESPDCCPLMCDQYSTQDNRVVVIHKKNEGLGLARNSGLAIAKGEYVYFVDPDDYLAKDALEKLYSYAKMQQCDICMGGILLQDDTGKIIKAPLPLANRTFEDSDIIANVLARMLGSLPEEKNDTDLGMSAWQGIYKRSWLNEHSLIFPSEREFISEDIIFHLRALPNAKKIAYIEDYVYVHIVDNPASLTHKFNPERFTKCCILYNEEKRIVSKLNDEMVLRAQRMYLANVRVCLKQIVQKSMEMNNKAFAKKEIKEIVNHPTLIEVLKKYPFYKNPIKQSIMSYLLKYKAIGMVYLLTRLFLEKQ